MDIECLFVYSQILVTRVLPLLRLAIPDAKQSKTLAAFYKEMPTMPLTKVVRKEMPTMPLTKVVRKRL
ncbi:MAG TPA: hypothetical protein VGL91_14520, partial [Acidobacteriota bacterium]